jgi:hypothetical protein
MLFFLSYQTRHRDIIRVIKYIISWTTLIGHIYYYLCRNIGFPYLDFEPIYGVLYLTNCRVFFSPTEGQTIKTPRSCFLQDVEKLNYCRINLLFKTQLLSIHTHSYTNQFVIKYADKWTEAIALQKLTVHGLKADVH